MTDKNKCLIFHDYGKYGELYDCYEGYKKQQARRCNKCGKIQVRSVRISGQVSARNLNKSAGIEV